MAVCCSRATLQLAVPSAELVGRLPLGLVELVKLTAHVVHPSGEGAELVTIGHVDGRSEVTLGDLTEKPLRLPDRQDERPGDDESEAEGEEDRGGREPSHEEEGATLRGLDVLPELAHAGFLGPHGLGDEGGDLPMEGLALVEVEGHRLVGLAFPDEGGDAGHRGHDPFLRSAYALNGPALTGRAEPLEAG